MANQITWKDTKFNVGDTIRVHQTFEEGDKTRTQIFEGLVIAIRGHQNLKSYVVRKIATHGIGVEKIFPLETPTVTKIDVRKKGSVRRAKLYYLRDRSGKGASKVKDFFMKGVSADDEPTETIVRHDSNDKSERPEKEEVKKNKVTAPKSEKIKKVKKGPKKIVRKERVFVR